MKIHFLGTCSGTEPMEGMHHSSFVLEVGDSYYWFDAGEGCSYSAYLAGIDFMRIRSIFVSHPHIDHIGGLANLFFCIEKLILRNKWKLAFGGIDIFFPASEVLESVIGILSFRKYSYNLNKFDVHDGVIYEDENVRVSALHNAHLREDGSNGWHSYSYLIEAEDKRVVFTGDVLKYAEIDPLMSGGCDLLIGETGHHKVIDVCEYAISNGAGKLIFTHHGREIIENRDAANKLISECALRSGIDIELAYDGKIETL